MKSILFYTFLFFLRTVSCEEGEFAVDVGSGEMSLRSEHVVGDADAVADVIGLAMDEAGREPRTGKALSPSDSNATDSRSSFQRTLTKKGVMAGTAEVVAYAMGDDEIDALPPQFISQLIASLLMIESHIKKSQLYLASLDASLSFLISHTLVLEQMKAQVTTYAVLAPLGHLYGNDAVVKRISQSLVMYLQRQLADPFPWTY